MSQIHTIRMFIYPKSKRDTPADHNGMDFRLGHFSNERLNEQRSFSLTDKDITSSGKCLSGRCPNNDLKETGNLFDDKAHNTQMVHDGSEAGKVANSWDDREGEEMLSIAITKDESSTSRDTAKEISDNTTNPFKEPLTRAGVGENKTNKTLHV